MLPGRGQERSPSPQHGTVGASNVAYFTLCGEAEMGLLLTPVLQHEAWSIHSQKWLQTPSVEALSKCCSKAPSSPATAKLPLAY